MPANAIQSDTIDPATVQSLAQGQVSPQTQPGIDDEIDPSTIVHLPPPVMPGGAPGGTGGAIGQVTKDITQTGVEAAGGAFKGAAQGAAQVRTDSPSWIHNALQTLMNNTVGRYVPDAYQDQVKKEVDDAANWIGSVFTGMLQKAPPAQARTARAGQVPLTHHI
ncbi:MAG: hypothetical protein J2P37_35685, partial [Ktedonobacteraceae bacterium]|nr:hypothetical protein [Ktedonobacteraceae bacterium]